MWGGVACGRRGVWEAGRVGGGAWGEAGRGGRRASARYAAEQHREATMLTLLREQPSIAEGPASEEWERHDSRKHCHHSSVVIQLLGIL